MVTNKDLRLARAVCFGGIGLVLAPTISFIAIGVVAAVTFFQLKPGEPKVFNDYNFVLVKSLVTSLIIFPLAGASIGWYGLKKGSP